VSETPTYTCGGCGGTFPIDESYDWRSAVTLDADLREMGRTSFCDTCGETWRGVLWRTAAVAAEREQG
jgi:hypothetical protein